MLCNLVPRVAPGDGKSHKMRDPGNEVECYVIAVVSNSFQETRPSKQTTKYLRNKVAVIKDHGSGIDAFNFYNTLNDFIS